MAKALGDPWHMVFMYLWAADLAYQARDYSKMKQYAQEGLDLVRSIHSQLSITVCLHKLGKAYCELNEFRQAWECYTEALQTALQIQAIDDVLESLIKIAMLWLKTGKNEPAVELLTFIQHHSALEAYLTKRTEDPIKCPVRDPPAI